VTWPEVWYGESPSAKLACLALRPASWLYALGWNAYRAIYDLGIKRGEQPFRPILVVGNLTVGGSGKTPVVVHIVRLLSEMGYKVAIGCSGYGGERAQGATIAPEGRLDPVQWGDEPTLLRTLLPTYPLIVGRARVEAARLMASFVADEDRWVLVMDDGFQHLPLRPTASILIDPTSSNHACLPSGPYREPRSHLRRADLVIGEGGEFTAVSTITGFQDLAQLGQDQTVDLPAAEADVVCAIGRPQGFVQSLAQHGVAVRRLLTYPDHDRLDRVPWGELRGPVLVTAKDAVKLVNVPRQDVFVARHTVSIEPSETFRRRLEELVSAE